MSAGYRNHLWLLVWFAVLFLQLQVVKSQVILKESSGNFSWSLNHNDFRTEYSQWRIEAPRGYRIRLKFKILNCYKVDVGEVWDHQQRWEFCGGKKDPTTIESVKNVMEVAMYAIPYSTGEIFWAQYEWFDENRPTPSHTTKSRSGLTSLDGMQRLYLLLTMMACVIIAVITAVCCGCKRKRRPHLHSPTPGTAPDNANLENEIGIAELNFGDPPPSYEEVTRQSIPDISSVPPSAENTEGQLEIDSSGLPSYREALRLSQGSLEARMA